MMHSGNQGYTNYVVHLAEGEQIIAVVGRASPSELKQLAFLTRGSTGVKQVFGPYGHETGTQFIVNANVVSIFGRNSFRIRAIGFFHVP